MSLSSSTCRGGRLLAFAVAALTPLALLAAPAAAAPPAGVPAATPDSVPGAWIVTLEPDASPDGVSAEHSRRYEARVDHLYRHAVRGYAARMSDRAAAEVAQDPRVASVERDQVVSIDAQTVPTGIGRIDGRLSPTAGIDGGADRAAVNVDVAVIDTGIDLKHTDLNVVGGVNCSTGSSYADGNGHGTHVAGTIGAKDNSVGVVGVAPGARLHSVRVLNNQGSGTRSGIICGIEWVTARASTIEVANMSLGGSGTEPASAGCTTGDSYHDALCRSVSSGITYVVAAGNESDDAAFHVPAAYDEVITVSALADSNGAPGGTWSAPCRSDQEETFADFSNYGQDVDLIAPGVCILSTWKGGGYNTISGTSMASPHVAGAAALWAAKHNAVNTTKATPAQVKSALLSAATSNWTTATDPDATVGGTAEPLLNVAGF
jgi:subtilisin family serine protease